MSESASNNVDVRLLNARYAQLEKELSRLKGGGGSGTSGSMTEDWKDGVDRQLTQLHADVRNLLIGGILAVVFLLGAFASAFVSIDNRIDALTISATKIDGKLDLLLERTKPAGETTKS